LAKSIVHVAQDAIRKNLKCGTNDPAIIVRHKGKATRHHEVEIAPGVKIIHKQNSPLSCGARVWIEVQGEVHALPVE